MRMKRLALALGLAAAALFSVEAAAQDPFDFLFGGFGGYRRAPREQAPPRWSEPSVTRKRVAPKKSVEKPAAGGTAAPGGKTASGSEPPPPPYEPQITRLSEVLGALAFLRDLCGAGDGEEWRGKMSTLINADAPSGPRRERLVASFNRGFRGYELTYRACTPNAKTAISRYLIEASWLTRDITYRYGNP